MSYDKDEVKENLDLEDVYEILETLGAEPELHDDYIISHTVCHHPENPEEGKKALYYFDNTKLFKCFTHCGTFDIFELIRKVQGVDLSSAVYYVVNFFNLQWKLTDQDNSDIQQELRQMEKFKELHNIKLNDERITLPETPQSILEHYPQPRIDNWKREFIPKEVCDYMGIRYDPVIGAILIPHLDADGRMVGIRQRTLVKENERFGKYRPWLYEDKLYNHPLGFNLYGLCQAKDNIRALRKVIVAEGEKTVLQIISYLGLSNDIAVAVCGSHISTYQIKLLQDCGVEEMVVAFDADFETPGDDAYFATIDKLKKIHERHGGDLTVSYLFDRTGKRIHSKMSPTEDGKETFMDLWRNRFTLY